MSNSRRHLKNIKCLSHGFPVSGILVLGSQNFVNKCTCAYFVILLPVKYTIRACINECQPDMMIILYDSRVHSDAIKSAGPI